MNKFMTKVANFIKDESGPTAVEYAVMLALIIVVCIASVTALGEAADEKFSSVEGTLTSIGGAAGN